MTPSPASSPPAKAILIRVMDSHAKVVLQKEMPAQKDWILGSSKTCDLQVPAHDQIYPEHLRISTRGGEVTIQNLSILGKVYLNGLQVEFRSVGSGDVIQIGPYEVHVEGEFEPPQVGDMKELEEGPLTSTPETGSEPSHGSEISLGFDEALGPTEDQEDQEEQGEQGEKPDQGMAILQPGGDSERQASEEEQEERPEATVIAGLTQARLIWLSEGGPRSYDIRGLETVVGRAEYAHIRIDDPDMSREHFKISQRNNQYFIADLESVNGTRVNGIRVSEVLLHDQDEIEAGNSRFQMSLTLKSDLRPHVPEAEGTRVVEFMPPKPKPEGGPAPKKIPWIRQRRNQVILLGVLVAILGLMFLAEPPPEEVAQPPLSEPPAEEVKPTDPWDLLTDEQRREIETGYAEAQRLMAQRAWEEAYVLLRKIQDYGIPYKDVDELITRSQQEIIALEQKLYEEEQLSSEKERAELIDQYLREGKIYLEKSQFELAREMFSNVLELDPLHEEALKGMEAAQNNQGDIDFKEKERLALETNERRVSDFYQEVISKMDANDFDVARSLIKKRLSLVPYTTENWDFKFEEALKLSNEREQAFYQPQLEEGRALIAMEEWRKAWEICYGLVQRNPALAEAQECRKKADEQLQERSRKLFQDSIVAESLGNLSEAKDKWKQILDISPPYDVYYKRSLTKLDLYK